MMTMFKLDDVHIVYRLIDYLLSDPGRKAVLAAAGANLHPGN